MAGQAKRAAVRGSLKPLRCLHKVVIGLDVVIGMERFLVSSTTHRKSRLASHDASEQAEADDGFVSACRHLRNRFSLSVPACKSANETSARQQRFAADISSAMTTDEYWTIVYEQERSNDQLIISKGLA